MADTPRVTVPVEDLTLIEKKLRHGGWPSEAKKVRGWLSAAPAPEGGAAKLHLKLLDTLKPFAEVAEKLKHCHVVEICEPTPENPSRNIIPIPREWFERAADDLEAIVIQLHGAGALSEGQASKLTGLDRVEVRKLSDAHATREEAPAEWFGVTGAVDETEALAVALFAVRCPGVRMTDEDLHHYRSAAQRAMQVVSAELSGNPGQLEAPAEAGEDDELIARLEEMADFFDGAINPVIAETVCDEHAQDIRSAVRALRAQPPAREGAQPFGYWVEHRSSENPVLIRYGSFVPASDHYKITTLYTHPAPDALRGAVEALEPFSEIAGRYLAGGMRADLEARSPGLLDLIEPRDFYRARKALAALQAEQGAK